MTKPMASESLPIAEALRLIRRRKGLTQVAASKLDGAPDFRTLSHWETRRKSPSLRLLSGYLSSLGLDFSDLQQALDEVTGRKDSYIGEGRYLALVPADRFTALGQRLEALASALVELESRVGELELKG